MGSKNDKFLGKLYDMLVREDILNIVNDSKEVHLATKVERVNKYLDKLKRVQVKLLEKDRIDVLRKMYYDRYIIKLGDVPESYLRNLENRYLDEGYGHFNFVNPKTDIDKLFLEHHVENIRAEQRDSLNLWLDYLLSPGSDYLEMWAKVWAFQGMLKIGNFDVNKNAYGRRSKVTVNPFVPFDAEIMGKCVELVKQNLNGNSPTDKELDKLVESGNFAKLYGMLLANKKKIKISGNDGRWVKYAYETEEDILLKEKEGIVPEYLKLYNSLQGYNTGWCTAASREIAKNQICGSPSYKGGDFYVYYSMDENGEYKIPRIAIRMDRDKIGEIRGIGKNQSLESGMESTVNEKIEGFPNADEYRRKMRNTKILTEIYNKNKNGLELTKEELRFLYEIDGKITVLEYMEDPRIKEIKSSRDKIKDFVCIFNCREDEIGFNKEDLKRPLVYYEGDVNISDVEIAQGFCLPRILMGSLFLTLDNGELNFDLPLVYRSLYIDKMTRAKNLSLYQNVKELVLDDLEDIGDLKIPDGVEYLSLKGLTNAKGLKLPNSIRVLVLDGLTSIEGLEIPKGVDNLSLNGLTRTDGLKLPEDLRILSLESLDSLGGLELPDKIIHLSLGVSSIDNLNIPSSVEKLSLNNLISADGFVVPPNIKELSLNFLEDAKDLNIPSSVEKLSLKGLINIEGLVLHSNLRSLDLDNLTSIDHLVLPDSIQFLSLGALRSAKGLNFPSKMSFLELDGLVDADGLELPDTIDGVLSLRGLINGEGLKLPKRIYGFLVFGSLKSLKGVILPEYVEFGILYNEKKYSLEEIKNIQIMENEAYLEENESELYKAL